MLCLPTKGWKLHYFFGVGRFGWVRSAFLMTACSTSKALSFSSRGRFGSSGTIAPFVSS